MNDIMCDIDEGFTRREIYEETGWCEECCYIECKYNKEYKHWVIEWKEQQF